MTENKLKYKEFLGFKAEFDGENNLSIGGNQVMQDWETPAMKLSADVVCKEGDKILEIGLGLGISANFIQKNKPKEHVIIEAHPDVVKFGKKKFSNEIKNSMKIIEGMWHDVMPTLQEEYFDGIFFDSYQFSHLEKKIFKEKAFPMMFRLLKKGGILTIFSKTTEKTFPKFAEYCKEIGFSQVSYKICDVKPSNNCKYWKFEKCLVPIIVK